MKAVKQGRGRILKQVTKKLPKVFFGRIPKLKVHIPHLRDIDLSFSNYRFRYTPPVGVENVAKMIVNILVVGMLIWFVIETII